MTGTKRTDVASRLIPKRVLVRLQTIEVVLSWEGAVNGQQLSKWYGITPRQASQDFSLYAQENPGAFTYSRSSKKYEIESGFTPKFSRASEQDYLRHLDSFGWSDADSVESNLEKVGLDMLSLPAPRTSSSLFRSLVCSIRIGCPVRFRIIEHDRDADRIDYRLYERVTPLKMVHLPTGWHLRFYDHEAKGFGLIGINRIYGEISRIYKRTRVPFDKAWHDMNWFIAEPRVSLSAAEAQIMLADWGIGDPAQLMVPVREALGPIMLMLLNNLDNRLQFRVVPLKDQRWLADPIKDQEIESRIQDLRALPSKGNLEFL